MLSTGYRVYNEKTLHDQASNLQDISYETVMEAEPEPPPYDSVDMIW
jgi:hypothetical protein